METPKTEATDKCPLTDGVGIEYQNMFGKKIDDVWGKISTKNNVLPDSADVLKAFKLCPWNKLSVVLIGQDPYPTPGNAMGLCFSVNKGKSVPPSLKNIYSCLLHNDLVAPTPKHGDLSGWAKQGVLMLNSSLTTENGVAGAHMGIWSAFTDGVIEEICEMATMQKKELIFILWGGFAQKKASIVRRVNNNNPTLCQHKILVWGHPSPTSTYNKSDNPNHFKYCDNFTVCNDLLEARGIESIDWDPDV